MDILILVVALAPVVDVAATALADTLAYRRWLRFFLSPMVVANCDVDGCEHPPGVDLGEGVRVCPCHLI